MSDCSNSRLEPYKRCTVQIIFTDRKEKEFTLPINLMNREISHFKVDGVRYTKQRKHEESCEVKELDG